MSWVAKIIVIPLSRFNLRSNRIIALIPFGSSPLVGSSSRMTRGCIASTPAMVAQFLLSEAQCVNVPHRQSLGIHHGQGFSDPVKNICGTQSHVDNSHRNILFDGCSEELVIRVLKHHTNLAEYLRDTGLKHPIFFCIQHDLAEVGFSSPIKFLNSVVLPHPLAPIRASISPLFTSRLRFCKTLVPSGYLKDMLSSVIISKLLPMMEKQARMTANAAIAM